VWTLVRSGAFHLAVGFRRHDCIRKACQATAVDGNYRITTDWQFVGSDGRGAEEDDGVPSHFAEQSYAAVSRSPRPGISPTPAFLSSLPIGSSYSSFRVRARSVLTNEAK
jgi:hypothetical protein